MRDTPHAGFYRRRGKRWLDLILALPALLGLLPLLLVVAGLVRIKLGRPVLFRQKRVGQDERVFRLTKFRTMTNARDAHGRLLPDGERLTAFGLLLRRWSLDELPQLFNVVRGELSLVGPRPLIVRYLPRYSARQRRRHEVAPGITGWAQVNGRNLLSWEARFEHDLWYVENCSLRLDLEILLRTVVNLFDTEATVATGGVEVDEFWGKQRAPAGDARAFSADERE